MVKKMRSKRKLFLFHEASKEDVCKKVSKRMPKPPEKWENNFNLEKSSENSTKITNLKEQLLKSMKKSGRTLPNILVTGTPGTGKSLLSKGLASNTPFTLMSISDMVKEKGWYESKDTVLDTFVIDEDTLLDNIEPRLKLGGCIVDFHGCEMFPDAAFDLVVVLRCTTEVLYDRLKER